MLSRYTVFYVFAITPGLKTNYIEKDNRHTYYHRDIRLCHIFLMKCLIT